MSADTRPAAEQSAESTSDRDAQLLAGLILSDPDGGAMVISSDLSNESDGSMRFTVTNPVTGRRFGVVLGLAELVATPAAQVQAQPIYNVCSFKDGTWSEVSKEVYDKRHPQFRWTNEAQVQAQPVACGACNGSGWVPRDPDIGTEQECFACDGSGESDEGPTLQSVAVSVQAQPVAWEYELYANRDGEGLDWRVEVCRHGPYLPSSAVRNLRPLIYGDVSSPTVAVPDDYQTLFNAIAAATHIEAGAISVSVKAFRDSLAAPVAPQSPAPACKAEAFSSRMCEDGTKSCVTEHGQSPAPVSAGEPAGWSMKMHEDGWIFFKRPDDMRATIAPGEVLGSHGDTLYMLMKSSLAAPVATKASEDARDRMADCGTAHSFLAINDEQKRLFFVQAMEDSVQLKLMGERMQFLHSPNQDADGWEWGVVRIRTTSAGKVEYLWGLSDHSDIDAERAHREAADGKDGA